MEEWERTLCENKAVAILAQMQVGRPALIQKDGGEMLIAIVLDRRLADAKALVDDPAAFTREMTKILLEKQSHPLIMEIYTPVHMDCMCYVSGCNLHGGYNKMLSMVYLGRTLKLMQNGLRTTGIGYNTVKMRFVCM